MNNQEIQKDDKNCDIFENDNTHNADYDTENEIQFESTNSILLDIQKNDNSLDLQSLIENVTGNDDEDQIARGKKSNQRKLNKNIKKIMKNESKMSDTKQKKSFFKTMKKISLYFIVITWFIGVLLVFLYYFKQDLFFTIKNEVEDFIRQIFEK